MLLAYPTKEQSHGIGKINYISENGRDIPFSGSGFRKTVVAHDLVNGRARPKVGRDERSEVFRSPNPENGTLTGY